MGGVGNSATQEAVGEFLAPQGEDQEGRGQAWTVFACACGAKTLWRVRSHTSSGVSLTVS